MKRSMVYILALVGMVSLQQVSHIQSAQESTQQVMSQEQAIAQMNLLFEKLVGTVFESQEEADKYLQLTIAIDDASKAYAEEIQEKITYYQEQLQAAADQQGVAIQDIFDPLDFGQYAQQIVLDLVGNDVFVDQDEYSWYLEKQAEIAASLQALM